MIWEAVESFSGWANTHIGKKVLERVKPAFADCNARAAVAGVSHMRLSEASFLHRKPRLIGSRAYAAALVAMRRFQNRIAFSRIAAATQYFAIFKRRSKEIPFGSTGALAQPSSVTMDTHSEEADHEQSAESLSGKLKGPCVSHGTIVTHAQHKSRAEHYLLLYGPLSFGCGPSASQEGLAGSETQFMDTLQSNYNTNFADQQSVLNHLNSVLSPIVQAGPDQTGFSPSELAAFNTQAIDSTGAAAANTERAIGNETAGRSDSGNLAEAGNVQALKANAASAAEGQLSNEELGITEADYATGRSNFQNAESAELGVSGQYNPVAYAGAANTANTGAFGEETQINKEQSQEQADIAAGITSLAEGAIGGFGNLDTTGGSSGGEQAMNFLEGF